MLGEFGQLIAIISAVVGGVMWLQSRLGAYGERIARIETKLDMVAKQLGLSED